MNSYIEIDRLFGTPLNQVPKPKVPFKIKTWHIITVGALAIAAVYGVYTFCNDVKSKFKRKDSDDDSSKFNFKKFCKDCGKLFRPLGLGYSLYCSNCLIKRKNKQ